VFGADGSERLAADPLAGADCKGGSVWMPLAALLMREPGIDKVVLVPMALKGVKAKDWNQGDAGRRLDAVLASLKARGLRIDYALWQHGLPDAATDGSVYLNQMRLAIKRATLTLPIDKWLIASTGSCAGTRFRQIEQAQRQLARQVTLNRFPGPSTDLPDAEQAADCSLTEKGQDTMAQRWLDAFRRADSLSQRYRLESLVYFFR
jgi:phosphatidylserine/phosphatidylglycerophosphate/cardiolipin synthase-like enzyme